MSAHNVFIVCYRMFILQEKDNVCKTLEGGVIYDNTTRY